MGGPGFGSIDGYNASHPSDAYGAIMKEPSAFSKSPFTQTHTRKRLNFYAICLAFFIPFGIFAGVFSALCFSLHYNEPVWAWVLTALAFLVVLVLLGFVVTGYWSRRRQTIYQQHHHEPMWYMFVFVTSLVLWVTAVIAGDMLYSSYFSKYYDIANLGMYSGINPSKQHGQELMDASRIMFQEGTHIDVDKSMSFRDSVSYCVAPVTFGAEPLAQYDFWAVGTDCCSASPGDFRCGSSNVPGALGGLRVFDDKAQGMYTLAVQQAQAKYHIQAGHPIFLKWETDAVKTTDNYWNKGLHGFIVGMVVVGALQAAAVIAAVVVFAKTLGHMNFNLYPGP